MIRPRGGDFVYSKIEQEIMAEDIRASRSAGADGIAVGLLNRKDEIDIPGLQYLVKCAGTMQVTFHKAIDATKNIESEFRRLRDSGLVQRVLTSGGAPSALEGAAMLKQMLSQSEGRITVLVAGKVTDSNLPDLAKLLPAFEFHGKKIVGNLDVLR
jgi:copper homeostasis protein